MRAPRPHGALTGRFLRVRSGAYQFRVLVPALVSQPDRRRLRVGDYRLVYTIDNGELVVWVVHVGHRSTVYDA